MVQGKITLCGYFLIPSEISDPPLHCRKASCVYTHLSRRFDQQKNWVPTSTVASLGSLAGTSRDDDDDDGSLAGTSRGQPVAFMLAVDDDDDDDDGQPEAFKISFSLYLYAEASLYLYAEASLYLYAEEMEALRSENSSLYARCIM